MYAHSFRRCCGGGLLIALFFAFFASTGVRAVEIASPGAVLSVVVRLDAGRPIYEVRRFGEQVIAPSRLGLEFQDAPSLAEGLRILKAQAGNHDETWEQPWGERARVRNRYNELRVDFTREEGTERVLSVVFRVYDDGVGFRYEVPGAPGVARTVSDEATEFALTGDHEAWWTGAYLPNRYEYLYRHTPVSAIRKAETPLTMKTAAGLYLSFHEAALVDYAEMTLANAGGHRLKADLVPWSDGARVRTQGAFRTPWRTILVTDSAAGLIDAADLTLNLNEPNRLGDVS